MLWIPQFLKYDKFGAIADIVCNLIERIELYIDNTNINLLKLRLLLLPIFRFRNLKSQISLLLSRDY